MSFLAGCSLTGLGRNEWRDKFDIKPDTGVLAGKFDLLKDVKGKKFLCYLMDSTADKIVVYDTLSGNGNILFRNLPPGKYYIDAHESLPESHEGKLTRFLGGSPLTNDDCQKVGLIIKTNTITVASCPITYDKAAIFYLNKPEMPIIREDNELPVIPKKKDKHWEIKDECWLTPIYEPLNDSTYTKYNNLVK
jgi:hypothetical protein